MWLFGFRRPNGPQGLLNLPKGHPRGVVGAPVAYPWGRGSRGMNLREDFELLESLFVELDPLVAAGVLLEVYRRGDRYVLLETAPTTGNRLLRFSSKDKRLVYAAFAREIGYPTR